MASKPESLLVETTRAILANTNATDVFTVSDEEDVFLLSIVVVDSTGAVATAALVQHRSGGTNYTLLPTTAGLPSATENLEIVCEPAMRMTRGDSVRITGANGHHCFVSVQPIRSSSTASQR